MQNGLLDTQAMGTYPCHASMHESSAEALPSSPRPETLNLKPSTLNPQPLSGAEAPAGSGAGEGAGAEGADFAGALAAGRGRA